MQPIFLLSVALLSLPLLANSSSFPRTPNIVFIVVDDLGHTDVSFRSPSSSDIRTPAIDALRSNGVLLNNYYVHAVCSPSRSTFLTGRYAHHHGVVDWIPEQSTFGLPLNETTLAQKLKAANYSTKLTGKWHAGFYKWALTPTFRGFDEFVGFYSGGEDYFTHKNGEGYDFRRDSSPNCGANCSIVNTADAGVYSTEVFSREAVRMISEHPSESDTPLFLMVTYQGVHSPSQAPQRYIDMYNDTISDSTRRTFAGMISAVDEGIFNITEALREKGMYDDTVFVFTSDNGGPIQGGDATGTRNWPLRGGKHSVWEGGVRATAFVSYEQFSDTAKNSAYDGLMHGADWFATLADVGGYDLNNTLPLDGLSHWAQICTGATNDNEDDRTIALGNATDLCSWPIPNDPRRGRFLRKGHKDAVKYEGGYYFSASDGSGASGGDMPSCGFAIKKGDYKLIQGYGGSPMWTCNISDAGEQDSCRDGDTAPVCPNGWCLYNVESDTEELNELSLTNDEALQEMQSAMAIMLDSYTEYTLDDDCPPFAFVNSSEGKTYGPWC